MIIHKEKNAQREQGYACEHAQEWACAWYADELSFRCRI